MLNGSAARRLRSVVGVFALTSSLAFVGLIANPSPAYASLSPVALGSASTYAVLGGTGVTSSGNTVLIGDLGVSPSNSILGFPLGVYSGAIHAGDSQAAQAQSDLQLAYNAAAALTPTGSFAGDQNGQTFDAGVYSTGAAFALTGTLTLDGQGNPNAVFVFQVNAALNTAASSSIHLINGARASNVFWQVNGAAGTGAPSSFTGTIMANGAITVGAGGSIDGRALSNGTVTLADNAIIAPVPTATITSPGTGNTYTQGQVVPTGFTCADPNGPGIATCLDSDASTSPGALDTSATGPFTYSVTATSSDGQSATASITQWSATPAYSVTFSGNGSTAGSTATETTNSPTALNLNGFSSTGYAFSGWNTSANGSGTGYADGATYAFGANATLYAQWTANSPGGGNTAPPTITSISPASGLAVGGTRVTITGTNFTGTYLVDFGTTVGTNVNVVNSTTITVTSPAGAGGPDNVTVTTPGGTSAISFADDFTYVDTITLIQDSPTSEDVPDGGGYSGQCAVTNAVAILRYAETASADSADVVVSSTGAISAPSTLAPGTYSVSGDDGDANGDSGTWSFALTVMPTTPTTPANAPGYDLVGSDGGVFVFGPAGTGFYGSLPGIGVHVNDIVGMVTTTDNKGYYLVGSDGGVFAFGDATFFGSLPGMGIKVNNIVGMVATADNKGYYLVGRDGGVFAFGDAAFEGSLPELGIQVDNVVGIAATFGDQGYWIVGSGGQVYAFGDAKNLGSAAGLITAITPTLDGAGYWLIGPDGGVFAFGTAPFEGSLPGIGITVTDVVSLVTSAGGNGYVLIGRDGGVFAFGTAPFEGSLPGIGVEVTNIVGAVRTD